MRGAAALLALLLMGGCKPKPPAVPVALTAALSEARQAMSVGTPDRVRAACQALTVVLVDVSRTHPSSSELSGLAGEVNELAQAGLPALAARDAFSGIDARLQRVLAGEKAGPGPRVRLDAPPAVRDAVAEVDGAFHRWALGEACDAVDQATMRLSQWRWDDPPPPRAERIQSALEVVDAMPATCRAGGVQAAQQSWDRAIAMLAPGVE